MTETLAKKTRDFWKLSRTWRGRSKSQMTTEKGLAVTREILSGTGPHRILVGRVEILQHLIITGKELPNEYSA